MDLTLLFQPAKRSYEKQQLLFGKIALFVAPANSFSRKFWSEGADASDACGCGFDENLS